MTRQESGKVDYGDNRLSLTNFVRRQRDSDTSRAIHDDTIESVIVSSRFINHGGFLAPRR